MTQHNTDETPAYALVEAQPNWHRLMDLVSQVAMEPALHAIDAGLMGMVDFLVERDWTEGRIALWLAEEARGPLPWVVFDSQVEVGQTPELGRFATEELAAKFIETLPDYEDGRYSLDGPPDDL